MTRSIKRPMGYRFVVPEIDECGCAYLFDRLIFISSYRRTCSSNPSLFHPCLSFLPKVLKGFPHSLIGRWIDVIVSIITYLLYYSPFSSLPPRLDILCSSCWNLSNFFGTDIDASTTTMFFLIVRSSSSSPSV